MAFRNWQIGMHIQQDSVFSVALTPAEPAGRYAAGGISRYHWAQLKTGSLKRHNSY
jgi:hypothetical protein